MIGTGQTEREQILIDAQARDWQLKVQAAGLQAEDMEAFGQWMATPAHADAYADCEWSSACLQALDRQSDEQWTDWKHEATERAQRGSPKVEPLADWSNLVFAPNARARNRGGSGLMKHALAIAACVAVASLGLSWQRTTTPDVLHYQAGHATREILLPDGTRLTLDAGTSVDYMRTGDTRRLLLPVGRVYLSVSKDPDHARFVVQSGQVETVVLGTRFQVSQNGDSTEVLLEEGSVRMQRPGTSAYAMLIPGQRGWWSAETNGFQTGEASPASALAWTRGRLLFEDVSLADAISEVNRYSGHIQIELVDPRAAALKVNGSYVAGDAELVVAAWEATMPVHAVHQGDRIRIEYR